MRGSRPPDSGEAYNTSAPEPFQWPAVRLWTASLAARIWPRAGMELLSPRVLPDRAMTNRPVGPRQGEIRFHPFRRVPLPYQPRIGCLAAQPLDCRVRGPGYLAVEDAG